MKRQTQILLLVSSLTLVALLATMFVLQRMTGSLDKLTVRQERFGSVSIQVPDSFGSVTKRQDHGWEILEFRDARFGRLQLGTEPVRGWNFQDACKFWFALPTYPAGPLNYQAGRHRWFFKELPLFGRGAYALRQRGKSIRIVCAFEQDGLNHWIGLDTKMTFMVEKDLFDRLLLSLRLPDGTAPSAGLARALATVPEEGRYRFFQPAWFLVAVPLLGLALVFGLVNVIQRFSGRLPKGQVFGGHAPLFLEGGLEICLSRAWQHKFMDGAVAVTDEGLTVFTFGTPFLFVPRSAYQGKVATGQGWLGNPFLSLRVEGAANFRKWAVLYRGAFFTLKIYSPDISRLRAVLQG